MFLPNRPAEFNVSSKQTEANSSAARNLTNFAPLNRRDDLCLASFFSGNIYIHNQQIFKVTFMNMSTGAVYIVLRIILPTRQCNNLIFTGHGSSRNNIPFLVGFYINQEYRKYLSKDCLNVHGKNSIQSSWLRFF